MVWLPMWMASTALVWRETRVERRRRIARRGAGHVTCPECDYDLTGLREARCPECGTRYTLDQLFASAAERAEPIQEKGG
jgi:ssDNA-binding Zn-finger/Zn-ribbon topoisomerase 1